MNFSESGGKLPGRNRPAAASLLVHRQANASSRNDHGKVLWELRSTDSGRSDFLWRVRNKVSPAADRVHSGADAPTTCCFHLSEHSSRPCFRPCDHAIQPATVESGVGACHAACRTYSSGYTNANTSMERCAGASHGAAWRGSGSRYSDASGSVERRIGTSNATVSILIPRQPGSSRRPTASSGTCRQFLCCNFSGRIARLAANVGFPATACDHRRIHGGVPGQ